MVPLPRIAVSALWVSALALLGACRANEDFRPPRSVVLSDAAPLPVTLSRDLRGLKEKTSVLGKDMTFKIGYLLQPLFPATDGRAFLSLVDSDLELERKDQAWSTLYRLSIALQHEGTSHVITASGSGEASEWSEAGSVAIENCVEQAYREVFALLRSSSRPGAGGR